MAALGVASWRSGRALQDSRKRCTDLGSHAGWLRPSSPRAAQISSPKIPKPVCGWRAGPRFAAEVFSSIMRRSQRGRAPIVCAPLSDAIRRL